MGEMLEVERLDAGAASLLARRLAAELPERAEVRERPDGCVEVEADSDSLTDVLHALEEFGALAGRSSLCVRLNGRSYVLECRPPALGLDEPAPA
jgi:hypothetical protein